MTTDQENWMEIRITAEPPQAEAAADFLANMTGRGILLDDSSEKEGDMVVVGYLAVDENLDRNRAKVELFVQELGTMDEGPSARVEFKVFAGEDWSRNWKKNFKPREAMPDFIVAPPWERPESKEGQRVLIIDPGQAFGTGHHESTLLCMRRIRRLASRDLLPVRVLDVGCGTGILAMTALLYGAQTALGVDLDPEAITAAHKNARLNGLEDRLELKLDPLQDIDERFPLILANLTAKDITALAGDLAAHLAPEGELVVSGILVEQAPQVREALEAAGLSFIEHSTMAAWSSLVMA